MKRSFKSLLAAIAMTLVTLSSVSQAAQYFNWGSPGDHWYSGDTFLLNTAPQNRAPNGQLQGTKAETSSEIPVGLMTNGVPYPYQGSTGLVLVHDPSDIGNLNPNNGVVIDSTGNTTAKLAYIDAWIYQGVASQYWAQADVKPTATDSVYIGFLQNTGHTTGSTALPYGSNSGANTNFNVDGFGLIWGELSYTAPNQLTWELIANAGDGSPAQLIESGNMVTTNMTDWHNFSLGWDQNNKAFLAVDGNKVSQDWDVSSSNIAGLSWSIADVGGVGFQLSGGAQLDNFAALPEPSSILMLGMGGIGFGYLVVRTRRKREGVAAAERTL